jgi:glucose 1-dehydrogenase
VNFVHGRDEADAVVDEIERAGGAAFAVQADVSKEADVDDMFARVTDRYGRLHVLVNNAGIQKDSALVDMTLDDWNSVIAVNLTGQFLCARRAAQIFIGQGRDEAVSRSTGKIICMSSVHQVIPWECRVNYAASKGGVLQLMRSLAQELARHGIRVNGIAPGAIKTAINRADWESEDAERALLQKIPYGRVGDPEDVARAVRWLASDDSDYVHGATLFIDGGMTLYPGFWNAEAGAGPDSD